MILTHYYFFLSLLADKDRWNYKTCCPTTLSPIFDIDKWFKPKTLGENIPVRLHILHGLAYHDYILLIIHLFFFTHYIQRGRVSCEHAAYCYTIMVSAGGIYNGNGKLDPKRVGKI